MLFRSVHLGGISFGSMYALTVYGEHPQLVRSLLLVSAYAGWVGSLPPDEVERRLRWADMAFTTPVDEWGPAFVRSVYGGNAPQAVLDEALADLRESRPHRFAPIGRAFLPADLRDVLPRIAVPTLLVSGELDERSPVSVSAELQRQIRGAELIVVPGAGHAVNTAAAVFNAAARRFLAAHPA